MKEEKRGIEGKRRKREGEGWKRKGREKRILSRNFIAFSSSIRIIM